MAAVRTQPPSPAGGFMTDMYYVGVDGSATCIDVPDGESVMEAAVENGVEGIEADCGGAAICGTCHVVVDAEWFEHLDPPDSVERDMLYSVKHRAPHSRLSCQIRMRGAYEGLVVHIPESQR